MKVKVILKTEGILKGLTNLEMIFILEICLFASKKNVNYQIKFTLKNSHHFFVFQTKCVIRGRENVIRRTLRRENVHSGPVLRRTIHQGKVSRRNVTGELST